MQIRSPLQGKTTSEIINYFADAAIMYTDKCDSGLFSMDKTEKSKKMSYLNFLATLNDKTPTEAIVEIYKYYKEEVGKYAVGRLAQSLEETFFSFFGIEEKSFHWHHTTEYLNKLEEERERRCTVLDNIINKLCPPKGAVIQMKTF